MIIEQVEIGQRVTWWNFQRTIHNATVVKVNAKRIRIEYRNSWGDTRFKNVDPKWCSLEGEVPK